MYANMSKYKKVQIAFKKKKKKIMESSKSIKGKKGKKRKRKRLIEKESKA